VLMLHHLVPEEVAPGSLAANLDYYAPRTAHGSSLSPAISAGLLARADRPDEGVQLLRLACRLDLDDLTGTTAGGLHTANFGGIWQALVHGFAGVQLRAGILGVDPRLPREWTRLGVTFSFRSQRVTVTATHREVSVTTSGPIPVRWPDGSVETVSASAHHPLGFSSQHSPPG
jgi:trehalose/maltose hydrolase-like predicted phosphorylase